MNELYCVIHKDPAYSMARTADFLAGELCLPREEALEAFKKRPGFLLENVSLARASAFNLRASACGFETALLSRKDLRVPPRPLAVSKVEIKTEGFYYISGAVREHLSFESVKAIAACAISVELPPSGLGAMETGILTSLRTRYFPFALPVARKYHSPPATPRPAAPPRETVFQADIIAEELPVRLRLSCDDQDYSGLGARKTLSSLENFRTLLDSLAAGAITAQKNIFLKSLLAKSSLSGLKYGSAEAYEKELVWLYTIIRDGNSPR